MFQKRFSTMDSSQQANKVPDIIKNLSKVVLQTNSDILELAEASCKNGTSETDNLKEKDIEKKSSSARVCY